MGLIQKLSNLPIDLGQGQYMHSTKAKQIAWEMVPKATPGASALEIGCGDGYWSKKLKTKGYKVTGIDVPREYPNVDASEPYEETIFMDANSPLELADNSFDIVWCTEVVEHLTGYRTTLKEMERVLKPGGLALITTPNSYFWLHYLMLLFGMKNKDWQNEGHVNFFHQSDIETFFPKGTAKIYGYYFYFPGLKWRVRYGVRQLSPSFIVAYTKK